MGIDSRERSGGCCLSGRPVGGGLFKRRLKWHFCQRIGALVHFLLVGALSIVGLAEAMGQQRALLHLSGIVANREAVRERA